jgi:hypothetical protein
MSIWLALLDYGSMAWNRCMRLVRKTLMTQKKSLLLGQKKSFLEKFDKSWGKHQVICARVNSFVRWSSYDGPRREEAFSIKVSSTTW